VPHYLTVCNKYLTPYLPISLLPKATTF
jgi:hypothetical protein